MRKGEYFNIQVLI